MNTPHTPEQAAQQFQLTSEQLEGEQRRIRAAEFIAGLTAEDADEVFDQMLDNLLNVPLAESPRAQKALVKMIEAMPVGNKPYEVFLALAKKMPLATVEMVPLRTNPETGRTEVLLTERTFPDDPWFGEWHVPGATIIATDQPKGSLDSTEQFADVYDRLIGPNGELKSGVRPTQWPPTFLRPELRQTRRGPELSMVTHVEVEGEPTTGEYVPVGETIETDKPVIDHHQQFIIDAARDYEAKRAAAQSLSEAQGLHA